MPAETIQNEFGMTQWRSKQLVEMTIRPDHTYTARQQGHSAAVTGRWRLSGRWIISESTTRRNGHTVTEQNRNHILQLTDQQLIFPDDNVWTKVR